MRRSVTVRTWTANWQTGRTWGETLETVGHTQDLTVEGSANIWAFSNKVLNNTEAEDVIGWTGVQPRREGAWRTPKPSG